MKKDFHLLIVDDHPLFRTALIQIVEDEFPEMDITETGTAEEAISHFHKKKFNLLITDITMPGRSGLELLKQAKEINHSMPVLILSMHPDEQYAIRAIKSGASGYVTKDVVAEELKIAIRTILDGKRYITPSVANLLAKNISYENSPLPHELLSDREFEVMKLITKGKSTSEIAHILKLNANTISTYRSRLFEKMGVRNISGIIRYAIENNLT